MGATFDLLDDEPHGTDDQETDGSAHHCFWENAPPDWSTERLVAEIRRGVETTGHVEENQAHGTPEDTDGRTVLNGARVCCDEGIVDEMTVEHQDHGNTSDTEGIFPMPVLMVTLLSVKTEASM